MEQELLKKRVNDHEGQQPVSESFVLPDLDTYYHYLEKVLSGSLRCVPMRMSSSRRCDLTKITSIAKKEWGYDIRTWKEVQPLSTVVRLDKLWGRSIENFSKAGYDKNLYRVDEALFRHLLLAYDIPPFLDNHLRNILSNYEKEFERTCLAWLLIIGQGGSLRKAGKVFPWDVPRNFAQKLFEVPATGLTLNDGVIWALTLAYGGQREECIKQLELSLSQDLWHLTGRLPELDAFRKFWVESTQWLLRNHEELDDERWFVIRRWLRHLKTEMNVGRAHFSWKGRTVKFIHRLALRYDRDRKLKSKARPWKGQGWDWQEDVLGCGDCTMVELTSPEELFLEGQEMDHCVSLYTEDCLRGSSALFSLRIEGVRILTIEWSLQEKSVVQVYGVGNREPTDQESSLVGRWVDWVVKVKMPKNGDADDS